MGFEVSGGGSPGDAFDRAIKSGVDEIVADLAKRAGTVRCKAHGVPVKVTTVRRGADVSLSIDNCCQEAINRAEQTIR